MRGSGLSSSTHQLKVELKDASGVYTRTAYRYLPISDASTTWQEVILDADVTNAAFWSYNGQPPDPTTMKELVFVLEAGANPPSGRFYIDQLAFVDLDDTLFDPATHTQPEFLEHLSQRTFLYFLDWYDPVTGLWQDRSTYPDLMSSAATGFGLAALAVGEANGWVERSLAASMITRTLTTLLAGQSPGDPITRTITATNGYKGFFYHFLGADGLRKDFGSELSPVDTALLLAGVLTVQGHFSDTPLIGSLADQIFARVEWDWMLHAPSGQFHLAWKPEPTPGYSLPAPGGGYFSDYRWDTYTDEAILMDLLALGSAAHPVPQEAFYAWGRSPGSYAGRSLVPSWTGSFFTYTFAHLWVDFRPLGFDRHPTQAVDWWQNSIQAAWAGWQYAVDHQDATACDGDDDFLTFSPLAWGLSAAKGPDGAYHAYGSLPTAGGIVEQDGTLAPYAAGMALPLLPEKALPALQNYYAAAGSWHPRFGFVDAYNLDPPGCTGPWYNPVGFAIDQGPLLLSIENYRSGFVWNTLKSSPYLRRAVHTLWPPDVFIPLAVR